MSRIYRVQDIEGRGPFRPGYSRMWADQSASPRHEQLLPWMQEFGADLVARRGLPGEHYGCGVRKRSNIDRWFTHNEQIQLARLGFFLVTIRPDRVLAESANQLVFATRAPLARCAVVMPWFEEAS